MAVRSHVDFFATLTPSLVAAASVVAGRPVSRDETASMLVRELVAVIDRWTALGVWIERVESGAWLSSYQEVKEIERLSRPHWWRHPESAEEETPPERWGTTHVTHTPEARAKQSASLKAYWARMTPEERRIRVRRRMSARKTSSSAA